MGVASPSPNRNGLGHERTGRGGDGAQSLGGKLREFTLGVLGALLTFSGVAWEGGGRMEGDMRVMRKRYGCSSGLGPRRC